MVENILVNREIIVYFDDGSNVTRKEGICVELLKNAVIFKDKITGLHQLITFFKIIRIIEKPRSSNDR